MPLVVQQAPVGTLTVTARPGERLDARTLASLDDLAPVVAATLHLAATTATLTRSRRRLSDARDEERRALRRELHDGLGPALAGIGLGMQAARNQLAVDPGIAAGLLDRLSAELEHRVEEVRGMARGLLPPTLGDRGLEPALEELAVRYATAGLRVEVDLGDTGRLAAVDAPVATGAYAIVSEAVRNVHRHARTDTCAVRLVADPAELVVVVADRGAGVDPAAPHGVGLVSMPRAGRGPGRQLRGRRRARRWHPPRGAPPPRDRDGCRIVTPSPLAAGPTGPADVLRVMVVDDHPVFRMGMAALLSSLDGIDGRGRGRVRRRGGGGRGRSTRSTSSSWTCTSATRRASTPPARSCSAIPTSACWSSR